MVAQAARHRPVPRHPKGSTALLTPVARSIREPERDGPHGNSEACAPQRDANSAINCVLRLVMVPSVFVMFYFRLKKLAVDVNPQLGDNTLSYFQRRY